MQTHVSKSQFKAKALEFLRTVESTGESIIVTDRGNPKIEVRPYQKTEPGPLEVLKGSVTEYLDPVEPVGGDDWEELT